MQIVYAIVEHGKTVAICDTPQRAESWIDGYVSFQCQWEPEGSGLYRALRDSFTVEAHPVITAVP